MTIDSHVSCMSTHFNCLYIREDTESEEMSVIYRSVHVAIQLQLQLEHIRWRAIANPHTLEAI